MEITEVRIRLIEDENAENLRAFATLTMDECFVVRDLRIIDGHSGLFVAMPSRKITRRCSKCGCKNAVHANFCNQCGGKMAPDQRRQDGGKMKSHVDVAHPITTCCREKIHESVLRAYERACAGSHAKQLDADKEPVLSAKGEEDGWHVFCA